MARVGTWHNKEWDVKAWQDEDIDVTARISALPYIPCFLIFAFTFLIHWSCLTIAHHGS
jgi:hypothetical protein